MHELRPDVPRRIERDAVGLSNCGGNKFQFTPSTSAGADSSASAEPDSEADSPASAEPDSEADSRSTDAVAGARSPTDPDGTGSSAVDTDESSSHPPDSDWVPAAEATESTSSSSREPSPSNHLESRMSPIRPGRIRLVVRRTDPAASQIPRPHNRINLRPGPTTVRLRQAIRTDPRIRERRSRSPRNLRRRMHGANSFRGTIYRLFPNVRLLIDGTQHKTITCLTARRIRHRLVRATAHRKLRGAVDDAANERRRLNPTRTPTTGVS